MSALTIDAGDLATIGDDKHLMMMMTGDVLFLCISVDTSEVFDLRMYRWCIHPSD